MATNIYFYIAIFIILHTAGGCPERCTCAITSNTRNYVCVYPFLHELYQNEIMNIKDDLLEQLTIACDDDILHGSLSDNMFAGMPNLQELTIERCIIREITDRTFTGLKKLKWLQLSYIGSSHIGPKFQPGWSEHLESLELLEVIGSRLRGFSESELCGRSKLLSVNLVENELSRFHDSGLDCYQEDENMDDTSHPHIDTARRQSPLLLQELRLSSNHISQLNVDLKALFPDLTILTLDDNNLTSTDLQGTNIWDGNLQILSLGGNLLTNLGPSDEGNIDLVNLNMLDLSRNSLYVHGEIIMDFFDTATKLRFVNMSFNRLTMDNIRDLGLQRLGELTTLDLSHNVLSYIDEGALEDMTKLQILKLDYNELTTVENLTLASFKQLKLLTLNHNRLKTFSTLGGIPSLEELDLGQNDLNIFPVFEGNWSNLAHLHIAGNSIQSLDEMDFKHLGGLKVLNLSNNKIESLPGRTFSHLPELTNLDLSNNLISFVELSAFYGLHQLQYLHLGNNNISSLNIFLVGLKNLTHLTMSNNKLTTVPRRMLPTKLHFIYLDNNKIKVVEQQAFEPLSEIKVVDLSYNSIERLSVNDLMMSSEAWPIPQVFLRANFMTCDTKLVWLKGINKYPRNSYFNHPLVPDIEHIGCKKRLASGFWLSEAHGGDFLSPYISDCYQGYCDCCSNIRCKCRGYCRAECTCQRNLNGNINIMDCTGEKLTSETLKEGNVPFYIRDLRLDDNNISVIERDPLMLYFWLESLYINNSHVTSIEPGAFITLFDVKIIYFQDNELTILNNETFGNISHLEELHLERNYLSVIGQGSFSQLPALRVLHLYSNRLMSIGPGEFTRLPSLNNLTLYNNPFICNCTLGTKLKSFLTINANKIHRVEDVTCVLDSTKQNNSKSSLQIKSETNSEENSSVKVQERSEAVLKVDFSYCIDPKIMEVTSTKAVILWVLGTLSLAVIVGIILGVITVNWLPIQILLYNRCGWFRREDADDVTKLYDVYVTCAEEDEEVLYDEIVPRLEAGERPYKVCVEARDWLAGGNRIATILASVKYSRRTLLLVTPHYFQDEWSQYVFNVAHYEVLRSKKKHLILVLCDKAMVGRVEGEMLQYIHTNTYLTYGTRWFWEELNYYLPKQPLGGRTEEQLHEVLPLVDVHQ